MPPKPSVVLPDGTRVKKWSLEALDHMHELNGPTVPEFPQFVLFSGQNGQGKGLSMVSYLATCHANGFRVVATDNLELKFGEQFDYRKFLNNEYKGCVLAIDELEEYADALRYQSDDALDLVGVLIQMRHEQNEVVATTQFPGEVLSRLRRRINFEVSCFDPGWGHAKTAGREIFQQWKSNPFNDMAPTKITKRVVHRTDRFWPLYNTRAHIRVGSIRRQAKERTAIAELSQRDLVWSAMWGAVIANNRPWTVEGVEHPTVSTGEVQMAMRDAEPPVMLSTKKIGQYLSELGAIHYRESSTVRRHAVPRVLFADAKTPEAVAV